MPIVPHFFHYENSADLLIYLSTAPSSVGYSHIALITQLISYVKGMVKALSIGPSIGPLYI